MTETISILKQKQQQHREGSWAWIEIQEQLNQIIAQRYLEYVNR